MIFEFDLEGIHLAARQILDSDPKKVILFYGEMGAGKTTLVKEIAKSLGVEGATSSPTFSLVNEYHINPHERLFHFDMYRLKSESEAYDMGMDEYIYSGHWCLIEWPELIPNLIPEAHTTVKLSVLDDGRRRLVFENI
ncbi:tRNA (adenosine(37)-N6)-threonylcarbamoyltransferase complex ATPase subunit type 1 TsaE [Flavobacterium selenitireducens]|uniref:tRNA (adenosine(37)-N6)-threonylcarbamoyltransferase complex ATPase subunit type 1 TsaE n=1 Tax=Flavobacterium selenitireducens TaxID=2722704 RepID=UPI00168B02C3|nr:tRNA (adenosine(37)-N6)-threonylcarbamoyltransferase complex ATPase subunit type 1 TsaE [Flavobacterium selenitireducens]MBD3581053.1 tRNA (adenosine(37)-N6)-threonylcarbamoyltransferase complex ATPase subunit type 1 TsaE [Flavobacterium selenitireducens]